MNRRVSDLPGVCRSPRRRRSPQGAILIVVLIVIALLSLSALTYSELMLTEREAVDLSGRQIQARALAESGIELARVLLSQGPTALEEAGGWYDNASCFRGVLVLSDDQARSRGRFTLLTPSPGQDSSQNVRFGLENESAKINLNRLPSIDKTSSGAGRKMLMALPNMTEEIADAILDWIDSDDEPRESGAEAEYYSALDPARQPKNGPIGSLEELLSVRGVTPQLLFGTDTNRNGSGDSNESVAQTVTGTTPTDGSTDRGWSAYLTLYSKESNLNSEGQPKIDVNQDDLETLYQALEEALGKPWATYIVAYRQQSEAYSEKDADNKLKSETEPSGELDLSQSGKLKLKTVLDLVGQKVRVKYKGANEEVILQSPFADSSQAMQTYLEQLTNEITTNTSRTIQGRININYAPKEVLLTIPDMTSEIVDQIVSRRQQVADGMASGSQNETWLLSEGILTLEQMKSLLPYVTTGGDVYRCQVVGYFDKDGPTVRIEAVLDATNSPAGVLFWNDLSRLGRGYSLDTLGAEP
jgi:type II secretory pathway component PulK